MPALTVNGVEIEVAIRTGGRKYVEIGDRVLSLSGTETATRTARKLERDIQTVPMSDADAVAWARLLSGDGHTFRFAAADPTGFYSDKGLAATETGTVTPNGASGKFDKRVSLAASATLEWTPTGPDSLGAGDDNPQGDYTLGAWLLTSTGPDVWTHYLVRNQGGVTWYEDGVLDGGAAPTWLTVASGVLTLGDGSARVVSDLFAVPFAIPTAWAATWGARTAAFPRLPFVEVDGELVGDPTTARLMRARDLKDSPEPMADDEYGKRLEFTLREK